MTLADYLRVLRVRARLWIAFVVIGLAGAALYNYVATVRYTATATSFVSVASGDPDSPDNFQNSQFAVQRVKSYAQLISSPDVIYPVIQDVKLAFSPQELRDMISVTSPPETVLMQFSVTDTDAERAARIANAVSDHMGQLIEEIETPKGAASSSVKVTLTEPAETPTYPSAPRKMLTLLLGLVAGLAVGFVAALVRHALDRRIKSVDDVRDVIGTSPLGITLREKPSPGQPLVVLDHRTAGAERYRTVRSALKFATVDRALRHIVISSPHAGDGKTTVACNLAVSWAQTGARVCLVEADLRRPGVSTVLGLDGSIGLTEVLVGDNALDDVLVKWRDDLLTVLPAGSLPPDPAALLGSEAMGALVHKLRDRFDLVIYDTAPMMVITDAVVLGRAVDGLVLVVKAGVTSREHLSTCVETLRASRVPFLGTVLGSVRLRGRDDLYYAPAETAATRSAATGTERMNGVEKVNGSMPANGTARTSAGAANLGGEASSAKTSSTGAPAPAVSAPTSQSQAGATTTNGHAPAPKPGRDTSRK